MQVAAVLGKKVAAVYYGVKPHHSYYNGCSAGGRQGISVASRYPDLFDGVVAGSPAVDWNRFLGAPAIWASYVAANTSSAISLPLWDSLVALEVLRQCDGIDGKVDGVITDPTLCKWNPHTLLCGPGQDAIACLTQPQIDGLKKLYQPILGTKGDVVFSPYDPGAEADITVGFPMNGIVSPFTVVSRSSPDRFDRIIVFNRRTGTTTRYTANPPGRLITSRWLTWNTRIPLTRLGFPLGRTLLKGWANIGRKAGRWSPSMVPVIRYVPPLRSSAFADQGIAVDTLRSFKGVL